MVAFNFCQSTRAYWLYFIKIKDSQEAIISMKKETIKAQS